MRSSMGMFIAILTTLAVLVYSYTGLREGYAPWVRAVLAVPFVLVWLIPVLFWSGRREHRSDADHVVMYLGFVSMGWVSFLLVATVLRDLALGVGSVVGAEGVVGMLSGYGYYYVLALAAAGFVVALLGARGGLRVKHVEAVIDDLPAGLEGFKIAQISDLHVGPTIRRPYVEKVVRLTNALGADMVALTGDIIDGPVASLAHDAAPLGELAPKGRVFFITGNHEYYAGAPAWIEHFRGMGIRILDNSHEVVEHGGARLVVAGVPDPAVRMTGATVGAEPARAAAGTNAGAGVMRMLLAHNPKLAVAGAAAGFDLQLSGHTHAGQFFPWTIVAKMVHAPHFAGLSKEGKMVVYVSAGTGTWGPPLRLGTRPEITFLTLTRGA